MCQVKIDQTPASAAFKSGSESVLVLNQCLNHPSHIPYANYEEIERCRKSHSGEFSISFPGRSAKDWIAGPLLPGEMWWISKTHSAWSFKFYSKKP